MALRSASMTLTDKKYFTFPGELLLRMLECLVLPLITSTVITGQTRSCVSMFRPISLLFDCMIKLLMWITLFTFPVHLSVLILFDLPNKRILNIVYILQLTGLSSVKSRTPGRLGLWSLCYFTITSVIAVLTGIAVVVLIQPGRISRETTAPSSGDRKPLPAVDAFLDLIR